MMYKIHLLQSEYMTFRYNTHVSSSTTTSQQTLGPLSLSRSRLRETNNSFFLPTCTNKPTKKQKYQHYYIVHKQHTNQVNKESIRFFPIFFLRPCNFWRAVYSMCAQSKAVYKKKNVNNINVNDILPLLCFFLVILSVPYSFCIQHYLSTLISSLKQDKNRHNCFTNNKFATR